MGKAKLEAMFREASVRGVLFIDFDETNESRPGIIMPPFECTHAHHQGHDADVFSLDDLSLLSQILGDGKVLYSAGLNMLSYVPLGNPTDVMAQLSFDTALCKPFWNSEPKAGDLVLFRRINLDDGEIRVKWDKIE